MNYRKLRTATTLLAVAARYVSDSIGSVDAGMHRHIV